MKRIRKNKETTAKVVKKPIKKVNDAKAVAKDISARGKKMFLTNRKTVSALKKLTKNLAKLITEANQTGDQKLVSRITKLFGYLGFNTDSDANKVTWCYDAKVKPMKAPKVKAEKKADEEKKPAEKTEKKVCKPRKPRVEKKPPEQPAQPDGDGDVPQDNGDEPTQEELEKLDGERTPEVLAGDATDLANVESTGVVDADSDDEQDNDDENDEDSESDDDSSEDEDEEKEPQSYEDGLVAFRREAWGNGDFQRDDI